MKLLTLLAVIPLAACSGATFEAGGAHDDAGASGDEGLAGAMETGGSSGTGSAGSPAVAGKPSGHAGKGGGSSVAGAAGSPSAGAPPVAGMGGSSATAGAGGSSGTAPVGGAGSAGTDTGTAGAAGAVEPDPPSCTTTQAFAKADAPDAFLMPAWSETNSSDNVCWQGADRVCTFTLGEWSLSDDGKTGHLSVNEISCDKPLYFGTPKDGMCEEQTDCQVFMGSVADMAVVDFGMAAEGDGYVASDLRVKAASSSGGLIACGVTGSSLHDELRAAVIDMLSMVTFSCGAS